MFLTGLAATHYAPGHDAYSAETNLAVVHIGIMGKLWATVKARQFVGWYLMWE